MRLAAVPDEPTTPIVVSYGHYCMNPPDLPPVRPRFTSDGHLQQLDPKRFVIIVANAYEITPETLYGKQRTRVLSEARALCFWLMRKGSKLSMKEIRQAMRRPDHTCVLWGERQTERNRAKSAKFLELSDRLLAEAKGTVAA